MEYKPLGRSGPSVSRIILGCMSFGEPERGGHPWVLGEHDAQRIMEAALEAGITTFDTANVYSGGSSEEIVGRGRGTLARSNAMGWLGRFFNSALMPY